MCELLTKPPETAPVCHRRTNCVTLPGAPIASRAVSQPFDTDVVAFSSAASCTFSGATAGANKSRRQFPRLITW